MTEKNNLNLFIEKMKAESIPSSVINSFLFCYDEAIQKKKGLISETEISPVFPNEIKDAKTLERHQASGEQALKKTVAIVLNGGLGTSMGLDSTKSLIPVKEGRSFLEIIMERSEKKSARLALMNSFNTHDETCRAVAELNPQRPPDMFVQNKFPKILQENHKPALWPDNPYMEWNPAGHGDFYLAFYESGTLKSLIDQGIVYGFVSNSDNLGASLDTSLLGYFADRNAPFMMEVARRTKSDSKGGHLARDKNGRLILRESSQCRENETAFFSDIDRHCFFNTNNIWINLKFLYDFMQKEKIIRLPTILNPKHVCPGNTKSPLGYHLETAMGSAISLFQGAEAILVSRSRFYPVKRCEDLMAIDSDRFIFSEKKGLALSPDSTHEAIFIDLDPAYYGTLASFQKRFPHGAPSLLHCRSVKIKGDVLFEEGVTLKGDVVIENRSKKSVTLPKGAVVDRDILFQ